METDAEFLWLQQQRETLEPRMQEILNGLSKEQQEILTEYFGLCQEVIWRVVELACFLP